VPWLDPRIEEGINRILDAAGASDIQDAIQFFHQMKDRRKGLEILQEDLERRKRKYIQDFTSTVTVSYEPVQDASVREFEMSIQDIEQHAAQADALNEAMRELIGSAYGWLKDQLRRIVMIMEEESAIREIHALIKRMPRIGEEERLILWMVDALRAIQKVPQAPQRDLGSSRYSFREATQGANVGVSDSTSFSTYCSSLTCSCCCQCH